MVASWIRMSSFILYRSILPAYQTVAKIYGNFIWRPVEPNAIVLDTEIEKENNLPLWAMRLLPIQFMALLPSLSIRG